MARLENTVFISYRRTDVYTALAVYENLKNQGYDVFFDYRSISSGDFEQIITSNIRARAHFLLILTPTALDRCDEPGDWLRSEIELAIDEKRNIVPLFFKGFRFGTPNVRDKLTGTMQYLSRYNGLNVHEDYFDEAMQRLRSQYLNIPLDTILHPVSNEVRKVVVAEQVAADQALAQIEDVQQLVKQSDDKPVQLPVPAPMPKAVDTSAQPEKIQLKSDEISQKKALTRKPDFWHKLAELNGITILSIMIILVISGIVFFENLHVLIPASSSNPTMTAILWSTPTETSVPPTPVLGIGSTMTGKDGMTLLYVPAGKFTMGSDGGSDDEKPVHKVTLGAFWIDKIEVTNAMFSKFSSETGYTTDAEKAGKSWVYQGSDWKEINGADWLHPSGPSSGISDRINHPVVHVSWNDAQAYCAWADRRLPTEAEWEKAASWDANGQQKQVYPWGNDFDGSRLNFCDKNCSFSWADKNSNDGYEFTAPVGIYLNGASPYGALDMAGNVWEWVADWYGETYYASQSASNPNPLGPDSGQYRVLRGGSWFVNENDVRSADRLWNNPSFANGDFGFRCAIDATP